MLVKGATGIIFFSYDIIIELFFFIEPHLKWHKTIMWIWILTTCAWRFAPWASCQIRKIAGAHAPGMPGTFSPSPQVSDPDMHHGTCMTHVPWCMPGSLTSGLYWNRRRGETFPAFPAHAQLAILRIWQEAHENRYSFVTVPYGEL